MRMLLRSIQTGKYLRSCKTWTPDRNAARNFESISQALGAVRGPCLLNLELVLTDLPAFIGEVPLTRLTLAKFLALERMGLLGETSSGRNN